MHLSSSLDRTYQVLIQYVALKMTCEQEVSFAIKDHINSTQPQCPTQSGNTDQHKAAHLGRKGIKPRSKKMSNARRWTKNQK
jgi:hypothetical protein